MPIAINANLNLAGLSTQNDRRDADLRDNSFEIGKYPAFTFVEKSAKGKPDAFTLIGDVTIHGVTKTVRIAVQDDENCSQMLTAHYVRGPFRCRTNEG